MFTKAYLTRENTYRSPPKAGSWLGQKAPSLIFYHKLIAIVMKAALTSKRGKFTPETWFKNSLAVIRALESIGVSLEIENLGIIKKLKSSCVFVGNHMSTLETFILPAIILPFRDITFVVKEALINYPVFKHVMISSDPIVVTRTNPKKDLKTVLEDGQERLSRDKSVIIFPQRTRSSFLDPNHFNTIGIKLAKRAKMPILPFALKTDAWGNGKKFKDFGKLDPAKPVRICFGEPMDIKGNGKNEHASVIQFIIEKLKAWS
jgi:1-acyl-sn-glycerol-3-phosphate acyltransferase